MTEGGVISRIEQYRGAKSRARVFVGGEYAFSADTRALNELMLKEGSELTFDDVAALNGRERRSAVNYALLLTASARTSAEVTGKLGARGYRDADIAAALDEVTYYGYVNDGRYAADFAEECARKGIGRRLMAQKLARKGISKELIDAVSAETENGYSAALALAKKRLTSDAPDQKELMRIARLLYTRGYEGETVSEVMRALRSGAASEDGDA